LKNAALTPPPRRGKHAARRRWAPRRRRFTIEGFRRMLVRTVALALALVPMTAGAAELVSPNDLAAGWFNGKTITSTNEHGRSTKLTFAADGKVTLEGRGGKDRQGTWHKTSDGFCMKIADAKRESCFIAIKQGDALRVVRAGAPFTWRH
jgi:hypothetical protein